MQILFKFSYFLHVISVFNYDKKITPYKYAPKKKNIRKIKMNSYFTLPLSQNIGVLWTLHLKLIIFFFPFYTGVSISMYLIIEDSKFSKSRNLHGNIGITETKPYKPVENIFFCS